MKYLYSTTKTNSSSLKKAPAKRQRRGRNQAPSPTSPSTLPQANTPPVSPDIVDDIVNNPPSNENRNIPAGWKLFINDISLIRSEKLRVICLDWKITEEEVEIADLQTTGMLCI